MPLREARIPVTDWGYRRSDVTYDVVGVWKDLGNGYPSLALAWNATNTLILGGFVLTATIPLAREAA